MNRKTKELKSTQESPGFLSSKIRACFFVSLNLIQKLLKIKK